MLVTLPGKLPADGHPVIYQPPEYTAIQSAAKPCYNTFIPLTLLTLFITGLLDALSNDLLKSSYTAFDILTPSSLAFTQYLACGRLSINVC